MNQVAKNAQRAGGEPTPMLELPVQHVTNAHIYGPGMPRWGQQSLREFLLRKPLSQVALVSVHCWKIGEPDGPYPIASNDRRPGEAAD
jgi:hypothetical protein